MNKFIGIIFSLLVFFAAAYAFAPRTAPEFPSHRTSINTLLLLDAAKAGERLIAVGERGYIMLSDDQGVTWHSVASPTQATLTSLYFFDAQIGWAAGHDSVILKTTNGGTSWHLVHSAPELQKPLLKIWFRNAHQGFAIGAYGLFLQTSDGGATWQQRTIVEGDKHMNALAAQTDGKLFIVGEAGSLLRSVDDGQTWQALESPYKGSFFGIVSLSDDALLVYGLRGKIFRSDNAGATWEAIETGSQAALMGGTVLADGRIVLAGKSGSVLVSHDLGKTFHLRQHPSRKHFAAILSSGKQALLFGESGVTHFELQ